MIASTKIVLLRLLKTAVSTRCASFAASTPFIAVNSTVLESNLQKMQDLANRNSVSLRPHVKTHKSTYISNLQTRYGAEGFCAAKLSEASVFTDSETADILITSPIVSKGKLETFLSSPCNSQVSLTVDSEAAVDVLNKTLLGLPTLLTAKVYIKVDTGLHRCGVSADFNLLSLARHVLKHERLIFSGLISHAGHAYLATTKEECEAIANKETLLMNKARKRLENDGIPVKTVSVGSTLTELARTDWTGIDEIRPGNYVFYDATALRKGLIESEEVALTVVATVISVNERFAIIDAGSKVLSSDFGAHGAASCSGYGIAWKMQSVECTSYPVLKKQIDRSFTITKLSEEHGWIDIELANEKFSVGDLIRIIPNHSCPVVNLANEFVLTKVDKEWLSIPIEGRGCVN